MFVLIYSKLIIHNAPWRTIRNSKLKIQNEGVSKVQQHAPKGQKPIAQGNALGNNKSKTKGAL